ncbi:MAG: helix-hairpin-helix domain-containing protein [Anderseniella sp.]
MPEIVEITGIGPTLATACAEAGFSRVDEIAGAAPAELAAVPGIGETRAVILINAAQSLLNGAGESKAEDATRVKPKLGNKQAKAKVGKSKKDKKKQKKGKKKNKKKNGKGKKNSKRNNSKSGKKK